MENSNRVGKLGAMLLGVFLIVGGVYAPSAHATASTIIWGPSTDIQPFKTWHLTSDFYVPSGRDATDARPSTITNLGLTTGVLPFKNLNAEVGFDVKSGTGVDNSPVYFNTKAGIPENAYGPFFPALAVGIFDVGTSNNKTNFDVVYARAAKTFSVGGFSLGRFSVGGFTGNKNLLTYNGKASNDGIRLGWERPLTEISDKWWVGADYQGSKSSYGSSNFGVSYNFTPTTSVIFGYDIYNNKDLVDTYTVQLDINF
ncbi:MAG: hypothetical protein HQL16_04660 [Candidatus Omnitrophica bacterium]|nr:hypothetical protein [Candidatus Omnitrophota bacterium]